jgi:hypothetical protein
VPAHRERASSGLPSDSFPVTTPMTNQSVLLPRIRDDARPQRREPAPAKGTQQQYLPAIRERAGTITSGELLDLVRR